MGKVDYIIKWRPVVRHSLIGMTAKHGLALLCCSLAMAQQLKITK